MSEWIDYSEQRPDAPGVYGWMVPNLRIQGSVSFSAHMRERNAGYEKVLSPYFDHWNGYRLTVPDNTFWRVLESPPDIKTFEYAEVEIEGITIAPCPFCKTTPRWHAVHRMRDRGILIGAKPHEFNIWWLDCCKWAKTPHTDDPVSMVAERNALLED